MSVPVSSVPESSAAASPVLHTLRFLARTCMLLPWLAWGLLAVTFVLPCIRLSVRQRMIRFWSAGLVRICGMRVHVHGTPCRSGAVMWVANHVSWIDIFVLNQLRPAAFVAKSEIRRWPVIGWLVAGAGTLFIDRQQRQAVQKVGQDIAVRFARGEAVGLFPEGTTTLGWDVLPLHASLLEPARQYGVIVQPVAFCFRHHGVRSSYAAFVGEESLVGNLWRIMGTTGLAVDVHYLKPMGHLTRSGRPATRQELGQDVRLALQQAVCVSAVSPESQPGSGTAGTVSG